MSETGLVEQVRDLESARPVAGQDQLMTVRVKGREVQTTRAALDGARAGVRQAIADGLRRIDVRIAGGRAGHEHMAQLREEQYIVSRVSAAFALESFPELTIWTDPTAKLEAARAALKAGHLVPAATWMEDAEKGSSEAYKRYHDYWEGTISGAERAVTALEITRTVSFTAAGIMATVATGGTAGALIATGITATGTAAQQGMEVHLGLRDEVDWGGIGFDAVFGLITSKFGGKLGNSITAKLLGDPRVAGMSRKAVSTLVGNLLSGTAAGAVHSASRALFDSVRGAGEPLTMEQFLEQLSDQMTDPTSRFMDLAMVAIGMRGARMPSAAKSPASAPPAKKLPPATKALPAHEPAPTPQPAGPRRPHRARKRDAGRPAERQRMAKPVATRAAEQVPARMASGGGTAGTPSGPVAMLGTTAGPGPSAPLMPMSLPGAGGLPLGAPGPSRGPMKAPGPSRPPAVAPGTPGPAKKAPGITTPERKAPGGSGTPADAPQRAPSGDGAPSPSPLTPGPARQTPAPSVKPPPGRGKSAPPKDPKQAAKAAKKAERNRHREQEKQRRREEREDPGEYKKPKSTKQNKPRRPDETFDGEATAGGEAQAMARKARQGDLSHLSTESKREMLDRYIRLLRQAGRSEQRINALKGKFYEQIKTTRDERRRNSRQQAYRGGLPLQKGMSRRGASIPDWVKRNKKGKGKTSGDDKANDLTDPAAAANAARKARNQAKLRTKNLDAETEQAVEFSHRPDDPEVRKAMLDILFGPDSPVTKVKFGDELIRRNPKDHPFK